MVGPAKLGADDRIAAFLRSRETKQGGLTWNHILLEPELGHPEGMNHILGLHIEGHGLAHWHMQFAANNATLGITENKGKLHGSDIHLDHIRAGASRADAGPDPGRAIPRLHGHPRNHAGFHGLVGPVVHRMNAVVIQGGHASHALIDVVAVNTNEQHHNGRHGGPKDLQRQIAFDRQAVTGVACQPPIADQAVDQQAHNAEEQAGANAEKHLEQFVVYRRIGTGIDG